MLSCNFFFPPHQDERLTPSATKLRGIHRTTGGVERCADGEGRGMGAGGRGAKRRSRSGAERRREPSPSLSLALTRANHSFLSSHPKPKRSLYSPALPQKTHTQPVLRCTKPVLRCTNEDTHRRERAEMFAVRTTRHDDLLRFLLANARASQRLSAGEPDGRDLNKGEEAEGKSVELWTGYKYIVERMLAKNELRSSEGAGCVRVHYLYLS